MSERHKPYPPRAHYYDIDLREPRPVRIRKTYFDWAVCHIEPSFNQFTDFRISEARRGGYEI